MAEDITLYGLSVTTLRATMDDLASITDALSYNVKNLPDSVEKDILLVLHARMLRHVEYICERLPPFEVLL